MENSQVTGTLILNARDEVCYSKNELTAPSIEKWDEVVINRYEDKIAELRQYCAEKDDDSLYTATFDISYKAEDAQGNVIHDGSITGEGFEFLDNLRHSLWGDRFMRALDEGYSDEEARVLIGPRY